MQKEENQKIIIPHIDSLKPRPCNLELTHEKSIETGMKVYDTQLLINRFFNKKFAKKEKPMVPTVIASSLPKNESPLDEHKTINRVIGLK